MSREQINSGLDIIGPVSWGTHFCQFYQRREDLLDVLVPYFAAGLANNEFCMWITAGPLGPGEARRAMQQAMPDFADRLARGQMEILPHTRWYLKGGVFDRQRVLDGWVNKLRAAQEAGYAGLRLSGSTFWLEKKDWRSFTDYEAAIDGVIGQYRMLALCTYSLERCGVSEVMDVVRNHEFALIRREGRWEVVESSMQRQARQALAESESRYRQLVESLQEGVWVLDEDARTTFVNPRMAEMLGYSAEEILGKPLFSFIDEAHHELARERMERRWQGIREQVEFEFRRKDGSPFHAIVSAAPLTDHRGRFSGVVAGIIDVTGRKRAEERLALQADVLSHISDAVVAVDNDEKVTYWNRVAEEMYGVPAGEAIGRRLEDLYRVEWLRPEDARESEREMAARGRWVGESFHVKKNGERAYVRSSVGIIRNADGARAGTVAVVRDRTKLWQAEQEVKLLNERLRHQAEDRLRAADASFRRAMASSADGIVVVRKDGVILFANASAQELLGWAAGEMEGTVFRFPLVEGAEIEIPRSGGRSAVAEMRIVDLEWEGAPAYLATLRDVTRRKQGLLALQESETRLRLLLDQIPCVSWTLDTRLTFTSFSGSGLEVFRDAPDEVLGMGLADYFKVHDPGFAPYSAHERALRGTPTSYELSWAGRTFIGRVEPLRDAEEHIVGVVGVAFDITERKRAEEQLRSLSHRVVTAQENERRKIARELHDEVGQLLTALKLSLDRASAPGSPPDSGELQEARVALRELMARVRSMSLELRPTMLDDLGLLPTLLWHFKRYTAQTRVQVRFKHRGLRKDLPPEVVTAAYRVVQEALTNAARHARVEEVSVRVRAEADALLVEVEDRGAGFDVDGVGATSAGLNGMRERALSLDGRLLVQSRPGEGTCIIAELPLGKAKRGRKRGKKDDNRSPG